MTEYMRIYYIHIFLSVCLSGYKWQKCKNMETWFSVSLFEVDDFFSVHIPLIYEHLFYRYFVRRSYIETFISQLILKIELYLSEMLLKVSVFFLLIYVLYIFTKIQRTSLLIDVVILVILWVNHNFNAI